MIKYTKIIVDLPRGQIESLGKKGDFHRLFFNSFPENYDYQNWSLEDLKELAKGIMNFIKQVKASDKS